MLQIGELPNEKAGLLGLECSVPGRVSPVSATKLPALSSPTRTLNGPELMLLPAMLSPRSKGRPASLLT